MAPSRAPGLCADAGKAPYSSCLLYNQEVKDTRMPDLWVFLSSSWIDRACASMQTSVWNTFLAQGCASRLFCALELTGTKSRWQQSSQRDLQPPLSISCHTPMQQAPAVRSTLFQELVADYSPALLMKLTGVCTSVQLSVWGLVACFVVALGFWDFFQLGIILPGQAKVQQLDILLNTLFQMQNGNYFGPWTHWVQDPRVLTPFSPSHMNHFLLRCYKLYMKTGQY